MCQNCVEAFEELWPELDGEGRMHFLWNCTAFPVGNNTREQLTRLLAACGKDLEACVAYADRETTEALREIG